MNTANNPTRLTSADLSRSRRDTTELHQSVWRMHKLKAVSSSSKGRARRFGKALWRMGDDACTVTAYPLVRRRDQIARGTGL